MNMRRYMMFREATERDMRDDSRRGYNYPAESRSRDDRGREHYGNGRYAPTRSEYRDYAENGDRRGNVYDMYPIGFAAASMPETNVSRGYVFTNCPELTKDVAQEWASEMQNFDGSIGAHWTLDQTRQAMKQKGFDANPYEFYLVMNMLYSDYGAVFKRYSLPETELYADLAMAWIVDPDAVEGKTAEYFCRVVK